MAVSDRWRASIEAERSMNSGSDRRQKAIWFQQQARRYLNSKRESDVSFSSPPKLAQRSWEEMRRDSTPLHDVAPRYVFLTAQLQTSSQILTIILKYPCIICSNGPTLHTQAAKALATRPKHMMDAKTHHGHERQDCRLNRALGVLSMAKKIPKTLKRGTWRQSCAYMLSKAKLHEAPRTIAPPAPNPEAWTDTKDGRKCGQRRR